MSYHDLKWFDIYYMVRILLIPIWITKIIAYFRLFKVKKKKKLMVTSSGGHNLDWIGLGSTQTKSKNFWMALKTQTN